jgi:hypothetical protein
MSTGGYAKFSVSLRDEIKQQAQARIVPGSALAGDRSSVLDRDLERYYNGLLKAGLKSLRNAKFSPEERACLGTLFMSTGFMKPDHIRLLIFSLEDSIDEMRFFGVDPDALLAKMRQLDLAALYALVDLIERDPEMREIASNAKNLRDTD